MKGAFRFFALGLLIVSAYADDFATLSGTVCSNATVKRAEPDALVLMTGRGVVRIPFTNLPDQVRIDYGYSVEKAAAWEAEQAKRREQAAAARAERARWERIQASGILVSAKLTQVLEDGALAHITKYYTFATTNLITKSAPVKTVTHMDMNGAPVMTHSRPSGSRVEEVVQKHVRSVEVKEPVFIEDIGGHYVDGDRWSGPIYLIGHYDYTTVEGAPKRVRRYTASVARLQTLLAPTPSTNQAPLQKSDVY
jgi:hypothetical protein